MSARDILGQANGQREKGEFLRSLQTADDALIKFSEEKDPAGIAESLAVRFLTLKHLFRVSGDKSYLVIAKAEMIASVEIASSGEDKTALAIPLFNLAKVYDELNDLGKAIPTYNEAVQALEEYPPQTHYRPAVVADFKIHLATAEMKNGDKSARERLEKALTELELAEEDSYNKNVWLTGAHMNLAHLLKDEEPDIAKDHLQKVKEIIESDERLILRKAQWEKLAETFE